MNVYLIESDNGTIIFASKKGAQEWLESFGWLVSEDNSKDDNCLIATISDGHSGKIVMGHVWCMPVQGFVSL